MVSSASLEVAAAASSLDTEVTHRLVVASDDVTEASALKLPSGVEHYGEVLDAASAAPLDEAVTLDDAAMILYTSGTTGKPKGALLTHGNITWNCINTVVDMDLNRNDVALMISPLFHVASLDMGLLPMLLKGATVCLNPSSTPAAYWNWWGGSTRSPRSTASQPRSRCSVTIPGGRRRTSHHWTSSPAAAPRFRRECWTRTSSAASDSPAATA